MIDYEYLEKAIDNLEPGTKLFKLLRRALKRQGRWKDAPRGKAMQSGYDPRRRGQQ